MTILLDTHILVWLVTDESRLTTIEIAAINDPANNIVVSAVSLWELRIKRRAERRRHRAELTLDPGQAVGFCAAFDIRIDEITSQDALATLPSDPPHGDPFDEMLLVHAQRLGARLLTSDEKLVEHPLAYRP